MAYTARQCWEGVLTELSKVNAPSLLLHEFNYYFNKAINQYINKRYNIYDINQQTTDDLRVLKATAKIQIKDANKVDSNDFLSESLNGATYNFTLPDDYLHMLNCLCVYHINTNIHDCYDKGDYAQYSAKRLTADSWSQIINDYYNRPTPKRPYYYIHNLNKQVELPTNLRDEDGGTDMYEEYQVSPSQKTSIDTPSTDKTNFPRTITLMKEGKNGRSRSQVVPEAAQRYGNASKVRCEIRYGNDSSVYKLEYVLIDYIKAPQHIRLTKTQVDLTEDTSQIMEFPDYVCQEIINEMTMLIMARTADPRLQVQTQVTQSIANPAQPQQQQAQQQQR